MAYEFLAARPETYHRRRRGRSLHDLRVLHWPQHPTQTVELELGPSTRRRLEASTAPRRCYRGSQARGSRQATCTGRAGRRRASARRPCANMRQDVIGSLFTRILVVFRAKRQAPRHLQGAVKVLGADSHREPKGFGGPNRRHFPFPAVFPGSRARRGLAGFGARGSRNPPAGPKKRLSGGPQILRQPRGWLRARGEPGFRLESGVGRTLGWVGANRNCLYFEWLGSGPYLLLRAGSAWHSSTTTRRR